MRLYDTITQSDLNNTIDLLLNNYHRELHLNIDETENEYCNLEFDISDGVDAGDEIIFNNGDSLHVRISDKILALMGYTIRLYYYQLDKGDYTSSKPYGELKSFEIKLENQVTEIPFEANQIYLQKDYDLILLKDMGYRLLLSSDKKVMTESESITLIADYTYGSVPVEDISVSFYNGNTLLGTAVTNENGIAQCTISDLNKGTCNFTCVAADNYSNNVLVTIYIDSVDLIVSGSSFSEYYQSTALIGENIVVDYGDGTIEALGRRLSHTYSDGLNSHKIRIFDVKGITRNCFNSCSNLISIIIPKSVSSIGDTVFRSCTGLTSVTMLEGVTNLGFGCFGTCRGLTSIIIPKSVSNIGNRCFINCTNLNSITLNWESSDEILTYSSSWIENTPTSLKISIPRGTTSLYTSEGYPANKLVERT